MRWNLLDSQPSSSSSTSREEGKTGKTLTATARKDALAKPNDADDSSGRARNAAPTLSKFERVLKDEEKYQAAQYLTPEDVPKCMNILDEFLMSYALVPQLRSFYRYGEFVDANWRWHDFKYCLSLKSEPMEVRRELWIRRKAEWWAARRLGASSEDVWDVRDHPPANFPPLHPLESPEEVVQQDN